MKHTKKLFLFIYLMILMAPLANATTPGEPSKFATETAKIWKAQKAYALALIDQMPADKLEYTPVDSIRTFSRLFKHIGAIELLLTTIFDGQDLTTIFPQLGQIEGTPMTKQELSTFVATKYDNSIALFENMSDKELDQTFTFSFFPGDPPVKTYREIITAMGAHIIHHRGQATIYLRMNGIKPAPYTHYW